MHAIVARTDISPEQRSWNAIRINKELDYVRDGISKSNLFDRMLPIVEELHERHKVAKKLGDDPNFLTQMDDPLKTTEDMSKEQKAVRLREPADRG